jgi:purine nucleosidase
VIRSGFLLGCGAGGKLYVARDASRVIQASPLWLIAGYPRLGIRARVERIPPEPSRQRPEQCAAWRGGPGQRRVLYHQLVRVHLDTDLGGDPDDACALAMLLGWPGVEIVGITTTIDSDGRRAAYVDHCLRLAGRRDIAVVAGAGVSMTTRRIAKPHTSGRYWPSNLGTRPSPRGAALDMLYRSVEQGATIIAIGPYTNLAHLEQTRPGSLGGVPVVVMGGWVNPPSPGLPAWGPKRDWNVQWDTQAAGIIAAAATNLTLVPLPVTLKSHLRSADLPRLRASGALGVLLARQSEAHAEDREMPKIAAENPSLPRDILNFHHDPVTCAVALGWSGAIVEKMRLNSTLDGEVFRWQRDPHGHPVRVVVDLDGPSFTETWLLAVETAQTNHQHSKLPTDT